MRILTIALLCFLGGQAADIKPTMDATAAWSRLKTLAGEWEGDKSRLSYELIAGGTALVERDHTENMPEMLTVHYMDGQRLLLTHYCMAGNQPRMEARSYNPATGEVQFQFLDATNLASPEAGHMRSAVLRLFDEKHLSSEWRFYENGKVKMTE